MAEIYNGRYALADPSSGLTAFSMECGEINMFGSYTKIRTTERINYLPIADEPIEMLPDEGDLLKCCILGIAVAACFAAVAIAGVATGGAALVACACIGASVGALTVTVGTVDKYSHTGQGTSLWEFTGDLIEGVVTGVAAGATVYGVIAAAPAWAAAGGIKAASLIGASTLTQQVVPTIIEVGLGTLASTKALFAVNDAYEYGSEYNGLRDVVFHNNEEAYDKVEKWVDKLCDFFSDENLVDTLNSMLEEIVGANDHELIGSQIQNTIKKDSYIRQDKEGIYVERGNEDSLGEIVETVTEDCKESQKIFIQKNSDDLEGYIIKSETGRGTLVDRAKIARIYNKLSPKVQKALEDVTIDIGSFRGNSYSINDNTIYLISEPEESSILHEIGHVIECKLVDIDELRELKKWMIEGLTPNDITTKKMQTAIGVTKDVFTVSNKNFIQDYQGRIYGKDFKDCIDKLGNIDIDKMHEIISVAYPYYILYNDLMKKKYRRMYELIERSIK